LLSECTASWKPHSHCRRALIACFDSSYPSAFTKDSSVSVRRRQQCSVDVTISLRTAGESEDAIRLGKAQRQRESSRILSGEFIPVLDVFKDQHRSREQDLNFSQGWVSRVEYDETPWRMFRRARKTWQLGMGRPTCLTRHRGKQSLPFQTAGALLSQLLLCYGSLVAAVH